MFRTWFFTVFSEITAPWLCPRLFMAAGPRRSTSSRVRELRRGCVLSRLVLGVPAGEGRELAEHLLPIAGLMSDCQRARRDRVASSSAGCLEQVAARLPIDRLKEFLLLALIVRSHLADGATSFHLAAASMPVIFGIRMSISTTSGTPRPPVATRLMHLRRPAPTRLDAGGLCRGPSPGARLGVASAIITRIGSPLATDSGCPGANRPPPSRPARSGWLAGSRCPGGFAVCRLTGRTGPCGPAKTLPLRSLPHR